MMLVCLGKGEIRSNETTPSSLVVSACCSCFAVNGDHVLNQMSAKVVNLELFWFVFNRHDVLLCVWTLDAIETIEKLHKSLAY